MTTGPATAAPAENISAQEQNVLKRLRVFVRGVRWFLGMLFGFGSKSSHESATHVFLLVGLFVEGFVLYGVISERAIHDFSFFVNAGLDKLRPFAVGLFIVVTLLLFCHQFLIFRNFLVPVEAARRAQRKQLTTGINASIVSIEDSDVKSSLSILRGLPVLEDSSSTAGRGLQATLLGWIERLVFLFFGVLTGEAGYCLTILREHHEAPQLIDGLQRMLGTGNSWGLTLGCVFLACATAVCVLVLIWDTMAFVYAETRARFGADLIRQFLVNDLLSFAFWFCLFCVVTPTARLHLGVEGEYPVIATLGYCSIAWLVLITFSVWYIVALGKRMLAATIALASEATYDDARYKIV